MATHTVRNSRTESFWGVGFSENNLSRLAGVLREIGLRTNGPPLEVKVEPITASEEVRTSDPAFFTSPHMPTDVKRVEFLLLGPLYVHVELRSSRVDVRVSGEDRTEVAAVFLLLSEEMRARRIPYWRILSGLTWSGHWTLSALAFISFFAVSTLTVYSVVNVVFSSVAALRGVRSEALAITFGAQFVTGPMLLTFLFNKAFPAAQFTGRLSDSGTRLRSRLSYVLGLIVIPIIVNLITR